MADKNFRHETPAELKALLERDPALRAKWESLTDLGRNEWICWTISPKTQATRDKHLARLAQEVGAGKRRPCCWPGCPHRSETAAKYSR